jgi:glutamyl-tRNA synthetase
LRLRADAARVTFEDLRLGERSSVVDDFVLRRADGVASYNLAVVVDDAHQGVDQVVRGDDLAETTPRQVLLQQLLGLATPAYVHVPLVLGVDGARLAKRHGAVGLSEQLARGATPEDVLGLFAWSLGWAEPGESLDAQGVLGRFRPDALPSAPWLLEPSTLEWGTPA